MQQSRAEWHSHVTGLSRAAASPSPVPPARPPGTLTFYYIPNERTSRWPLHACNVSVMRGNYHLNYCRRSSTLSVTYFLQFTAGIQALKWTKSKNAHTQSTRQQAMYRATFVWKEKLAKRSFSGWNWQKNFTEIIWSRTITGKTMDEQMKSNQNTPVLTTVWPFCHPNLWATVRIVSSIIQQLSNSSASSIWLNYQ